MLEPEKIYRESEEQGVPLLELQGKIMGGPRTRALCERIEALVAAGKNKVMLDFANVRWINSTGIGALVSCVTHIRKQGGELYLVEMQDQLFGYFKMIRLDTVFRIYETREAALAAIAEQAVGQTGNRS